MIAGKTINSINIKNALDNCLRNNELNKEPKNAIIIKEKEENNITINENLFKII